MEQPPKQCVLAVAPNGARRTHADHPAIPLTASALAETASACEAAGASLIHLHVRDSEGGHLLDAAAYREAIAAVREAVSGDFIIQVTTEAAGKYRPEEQMAVVRALAPEAVSMAVRELVPPGCDEGEAGAFFQWLGSRGVSSQYIVYSAGELERFNELRKRGVIPAGPASVLFVLGSYRHAKDGKPEEIDAFLTALEPGDEWSICAFGCYESQCVARAAVLGGHARVGFENNLWLPTGETAADNAALVGIARQAIESSGRQVASAREAREMFGMTRHR